MASRILALVLGGSTDAAVAAALSTRELSVSRPAITLWRKRHRAEIEAVRAKATQAAVGLWVGDKNRRLAALQEATNALLDVLRRRGLEVVVGEDTRIEASLVRELRENLREIGAELGEIPRAPDAMQGPGEAVKGGVSIHDSQVIIVQGGPSLGV